jgi:hypothetical protein
MAGLRANEAILQAAILLDVEAWVAHVVRSPTVMRKEAKALFV